MALQNIKCQIELEEMVVERMFFSVKIFFKEEEWTEDYVEEEIPQRQVMQARQYESIQYEEDEEDNWSEATGRDRYSEPPRYERQPYINQYDDYDDIEGDAWDDTPKPVNIPKKIKERQPEYEEEGGY